MKTKTILKVMHAGRCDYCRVKLDSNKFPYIVIDNEKIVISSTEFPRNVNVLYGLMELHMEMVSGQEDLESVLSNPDLTLDKISLRQRMRVG